MNHGLGGVVNDAAARTALAGARRRGHVLAAFGRRQPTRLMREPYECPEVEHGNRVAVGVLGDDEQPRAVAIAPVPTRLLYPGPAQLVAGRSLDLDRENRCAVVVRPLRPTCRADRRPTLGAESSADATLKVFPRGHDGSPTLSLGRQSPSACACQ